MTRTRILNRDLRLGPDVAEVSNKMWSASSEMIHGESLSGVFFHEGVQPLVMQGVPSPKVPIYVTQQKPLTTQKLLR